MDTLKFNIGCGYNRREGWLNADSSPDSAADRIMQAQDLDLESSSVSEISALQLVEHLGFFRTKYFLSECWRVLITGGKLTVETPHIEKTFEIFLSGDHAAREAALGWVYGPESPGLGHVYCFPGDLLAELLEEAGFGISRREEFLFQPSRPALRLQAVKKDGERAALNAALRRRLLDREVPRFGREEESAGLELAVRRLVAGEGSATAELEQSIISSRAALEYFTLAGENEPRPSKEAAACARLDEWGLQGRLYAEFRRCSEGGADPRRAFDSALELGRELIAAAMEGREPHGPDPDKNAPPVFTAEAASGHFFRSRAAREAR